MESLGSVQRPVIVKVRTQKKAEKVAAICEQYGLRYIVGQFVI